MNLDVTGLVLAGGLGRRMGGADKGLMPLAGRPLIRHVLDRLEPQVASVLISANQHLDVYRRLGHPVLTDAITGFAGPLAGLHAGLGAATTPLLVTVPCDSPFLPLDLVDRLLAARSAAGAQLAVARTLAQPQPVFALVERALLSHLEAFLAAGGRKVDRWYASLRVVEVAFDDVHDAFRNINTPAELAAAAAEIEAEGHGPSRA